MRWYLYRTWIKGWHIVSIQQMLSSGYITLDLWAKSEEISFNCFFKDTFFQVEEVPFYFQFTEKFFITNEYWILSNAFFACTEMVIWFFSFILLMWLLHWTFWMLNQTCILRIKSHLVMIYYPFFMLLDLVC